MKTCHLEQPIWENYSDGKILKSDVIISKNYLDEKEFKNLNSLVNLFLDIAENNAERNIAMYMNGWKKKVENVLRVFQYDILEGIGKISYKQEKYRINKLYILCNYLDRNEVIYDNL